MYCILNDLFSHVRNFRILPVLEPEAVARETIDAILTEDSVVVIPRHISPLIGLKA